MKKLFSLVLILAVSGVFGQKLSMDLVKNMKPRNIGPGGMSGRVTSIDVVDSNKDIIYAGTSAGGLWMSNNGGINFKSIFNSFNCTIPFFKANCFPL